VNPNESKHRELTARRAQDFIGLFGTKPTAVFSSLQLGSDEHFLIDVFAFPLESPSGPVVAAVTNGLSDFRMTDTDEPGAWSRRELIQYLRQCTGGHARRLRDMAWLALFDGFLLDAHHSLAWPHAAVEGTPWKNAFFLEPILRSHREFAFEVEGDRGSLLWHIPISDEERAYKREHGSNALIERMEAVQLPWVFDEGSRPPLL
jgi:hypothetical protein